MHIRLVLPILLGSVLPAPAQISIGLDFPTYPELVPVPGYPVYYASGLAANYFFYDGQYWVYQADQWYSSSWYNGPWGRVSEDTVPLFVLRIPVRYYQQPPAQFGHWEANAPPRWGEQWGPDWERRRHGWEQWNRKAMPNRSALPVYQRQFSGPSYPRPDQQQALRARHVPNGPNGTGSHEQNPRPTRPAPPGRLDPTLPHGRPDQPGPRPLPDQPRPHPRPEPPGPQPAPQPPRPQPAPQPPRPQPAPHPPRPQPAPHPRPQPPSPHPRPQPPSPQPAPQPPSPQPAPHPRPEPPGPQPAPPPPAPAQNPQAPGQGHAHDKHD